MSDINLTPTISADSLETCWLCQNTSIGPDYETSVVSVDQYNRHADHEEELVNLLLDSDCIGEIDELADELTSVHGRNPSVSVEDAFCVAENCGFCDERVTGPHRWRLEVFGFRDKRATIKEILLCEACVDVFREFLRNVGRDSR